MKNQGSYMEMGFHIDGQDTIYLRIPTVWDDIKKTWRGFIKTPISKKLIHAEGKDSMELQNNFNKEINEIFLKQDKLAEEVFSMFKPLDYWNKQEHLY